MVARKAHNLIDLVQFQKYYYYIMKVAKNNNYLIYIANVNKKLNSS